MPVNNNMKNITILNSLFLSKYYIFKLFNCTFLFFILPNLGYVQLTKDIELSKLYQSNKLTVVNRTLDLNTQDGTQYLQVSEDKKEGIVWLPVKNLKNGTIQVEIRGKDVLQQSFIGIAFHGIDNTTYDAIYCRPFNFLAKDSVRRIHAIQYVSHPVFTWEKLRSERNAIFEKEISYPPNPNDWFKLKIVIENTTIKAYINSATIPSLVVEKLSTNTTGKIGLFIGNGSGGDFKTIQINYKK